MNGILGMAELALVTALSGEQREYLELVKVSAEALLGVINDLWNFPRSRPASWGSIRVSFLCAQVSMKP